MADLEQPDVASDEMSIEQAGNAFTAFLNSEQTPAEETPTPEAPAVAPAPQPEPAPEPPAAPVAAAPAAVAQAPAPAAAPSAPAPAAPAQTDTPAIPAQLQPVVDMAKTMVATLQQRFMANFQDIKSNADLFNLMRSDPSRYNEFAVAKAELDQETAKIYETVNTVAGQIKQAQTKADQERSKARESAGERLGELLPDLKDPTKGPKLVADLRQYAAKIGVKQERLGDYSPDEFVALHKAMLFDQREASDAAALEAAKNKAAKAPQVQQPGTRQAGNGNAEKSQENYERLLKTGRPEDAAKIFASLFN